MLEALCHLQEVGLVHTDIKPDNVLFDRQSGIPKIIDLGDARPLGSAAQPLEGTLGYKAHDPPAANGATLDTFAVGAICYELTHGNTGELKNKQFKFVSPSAGSSEEERPQKVFYSNAVQWFKNPANRALHVDPDPGAVSEWDDTQKRHVKKDGLYGANTHYVQFVNALMHPDPTQRLTPAQALAHPFITDALMEPEAASQLTQQLIESRLQAKVGKKL